MQKRITILVVFVLLISFIFAGCNVSGNNGDTSATDQTQGTAFFNGDHTYDVDGIKLTLKTDIDKYIEGDVFHYRELWNDLGWHNTYHPDQPDSLMDPNIIGSYYGDNDECLVIFNTISTMYTCDSVYYRYTDANSGKIQFARYDGENDYYYINEGGKWTTDYNQIVVLTYVMEQLAEDQRSDPWPFEKTYINK